MKRIFELLSGWQIFCLFQLVVQRAIPSCCLWLGKLAFFRLNRSYNISREDDETLEIRLATESDIGTLAHDLHSNDESFHELYENLYHDGVKAWIAKREDRIVGIVWLYQGYCFAITHDFDEFRLKLEVESTARFVANVTVAPEFRRQGIFSRITARFLEELPDEKVYSSIDEDNTRSILAHEKLGFRRCGAVYYIQVFGRTWAIFITRRRMPRLFRMPRGETISVVLSHSTGK